MIPYLAAYWYVSLPGAILGYLIVGFITVILSTLFFNDPVKYESWGELWNQDQAACLCIVFMWPIYLFSIILGIITLAIIWIILSIFNALVYYMGGSNEL